MEIVQSLLPWLLEKAPYLATILVWMGALRLILKPLFTFLHSAVEVIPGDVDNQILEKVEKSKTYAVISFVLDYFASIKLPQPPAPPAK